MKPESAPLKQMLAAEYVLGTLRGGARRRFERWLRQDRWLRGEVRYWEQRFADAGPVTPIPPREIVWTEIQRRMHQAADKIMPLPTAARGFDGWRAWAMLATAASAVLAVLLLREMQKAPPQERVVQVPVEVSVPVQTYVAALRLPDEDAQWTVSIAPDARTLRVAASAASKLRRDHDYELWWVADSGVTSLGLLPRDGLVSRPLPEHLQVGAGGKVAVSREPAGGAPPDGGPTGPVLLAAPLLPSI
jgi:anti-sigma-K factor RskA